MLSVCLLKGCNLNISRKLALVISFSLCVCGGGDSIELHDIFFLLLLSFLSFGVFFFFLNIFHICQSTRPVLVCLTVTADLPEQEVMSSIKSLEA